MDESVTNTPARAWYLLQCKPRQDSRAEEHLERQGYRCYRPKLTEKVIRNGKIQAVQGSLFPGYIFVQLGLDEDWGPIRSTRGVSRIVRFGLEATPIPDHLIAQLQQYGQSTAPCELLTEGDRVRITAGAFAEIEAIFLTMNGDERVVLLMNILQREQRVMLPLKGVQKI